MKITDNNYQRLIINKNFKSTIKPTPFLKEGFEYAQKTISKKECSLSEIYGVNNFVQGLLDIINDGRNHIVEIAKSAKEKTYSVYYDLLIDGKKAIYSDGYMASGSDKVGRAAFAAVNRLTSKPFDMPSHYDRLLANVEKRPMPFKSGETTKRTNSFLQKENAKFLSELEGEIFTA